jgi:hypothetical protein
MNPTLKMLKLYFRPPTNRQTKINLPNAISQEKRAEPEPTPIINKKHTPFASNNDANGKKKDTYVFHTENGKKEKRRKIVWQ